MDDLKHVREALAGSYPREELSLGAVARVASALGVERLKHAESLHKLRAAEKLLEALVRRCEDEMPDAIDVPEIQVARALLALRPNV